ncbi:MAG: hypothetical protein JRM82_03255 [Nitrososphaerota archaeon]|nr:hypothetical protein [Nitrososphaerota archaeon]
MRALLVFLLCIVVADSLIGVGLAYSGPHDPCDSYGDCISGSIQYVHSNPNGTLYPGDSFTFPVSIAPGQNATVASFTWSYDQSVFDRSGDFFVVAGNVTGPFSISASVTFTGNSSQPFNSTLSLAGSVTIIQLVIVQHAELVNVTGSNGLTMRNPDGTFYRNDSFCEKWTASFQFSSERTDILVNVSGSLPAFLRETSSNYTGSTPGRQGYVCFAVALDSPYYNGTLPLSFSAIDWQGMSIAHALEKVPFAVVQYSPMFSKFTYTDYNSDSSAAYQKPFVTLVRYGGNRPGYSYAGNVNTAPFMATNSTGERALVDNYTFTTEGFSPLFNENPGAVFRLGFNDTGRVLLNITSTNETSTFLFDWLHRVVKYYFVGQASDFQKLVPYGIEYLNVTERLGSLDFAGRSEAVINTSYAYQPIFYSGNLTFRAVSQNGSPDPGVNVTVTAVNPDPLDTYLTREVVAVFGNDSQVIHAFRADLYEASAPVQALQPRSSGEATWEYLVNQTNLQLEGDPPSAFQVTVTGHGTTFTYSFSNSFGIYLVPELPVQSSSTLLEWQNVTVYSFGGTVQFNSIPLTFNFSAPTQYLSWSGPPTWDGSFLPPEAEPGGYSLYYPFLYGENNTVIVSLAGGGASASSVGKGASVYTTIDVGATSGGAQSFWVREGYGTSGRLLFSSPLLDNMGPPAPSGFEGVETFAWSPDTNGTVTLGIVNAYGVSVPIGYYQAVVHTTSSPALGETFLFVLLGIAAGFVLFGKAVQRRVVGEGRDHSSQAEAQRTMCG